KRDWSSDVCSSDLKHLSDLCSPCLLELSDRKHIDRDGQLISSSMSRPGSNGYRDFFSLYRTGFQFECLFNSFSGTKGEFRLQRLVAYKGDTRSEERRVGEGGRAARV